MDSPLLSNGIPRFEDGVSPATLALHPLQAVSPLTPSRRLLNTAGRIGDAAAVQAAGEEQVLGFTPRDFVVFGLPYKNPKTSLYVRRNGALTFTITGGTHGVPYAQDRLLVIWLATVFKVCGSPETNAIAFDSLRSVARSLGKASSGQQRQRILAGFIRLFDATFLASDSRPNAVRRERYQLMRRMRLWKETDNRQPNQHTLWPNVLVYDPVFANDIRTGAIPTDFQSVVALGEHMGPLSLYQFEAHSSFLQMKRGKGDRAVPVLGPAGLLAQIGCTVKESDKRKARATIRHWHGIVKRLWPDCPNELARKDTILLVRGGHAIKQGRLPAPEELGVSPLARDALDGLRDAPPRNVLERQHRQVAGKCKSTDPRRPRGPACDVQESIGLAHGPRVAIHAT